MNDDEAARCVSIGKTKMENSDFDGALKFFNKAKSLYGSSNGSAVAAVDSLLQQVKQRRSSTSSTKARSRRRGSDLAAEAVAKSKSRDNPKEERPYTQEQVTLVQRVLKAKTHYEVLLVKRSATQSEVKSSYRKLSLKLHPDKNPAPGADNAIKIANKAWEILGDVEKRKHFDLYGDDKPVSPLNGRHGGDVHQFSDVDLFNLFFGGGDPRMYGNRRGVRSNVHFRSSSSNASPQDRSANISILQLLPLLLLALLAFFSSNPVQEEVSHFSLKRVGNYDNERVTSHFKVHYFVKDDIEARAARDFNFYKNLDLQVEGAFRIQKQKECHYEKQRRTNLLNHARWMGRTEDIATASDTPMPACELLRTTLG